MSINVGPLHFYPFFSVAYASDEKPPSSENNQRITRSEYDVASTSDGSKTCGVEPCESNQQKKARLLGRALIQHCWADCGNTRFKEIEVPIT